MEIIPEIIELMMLCLQSSVQSKKNNVDKETSFELTTEILIVRALERGISLYDFENLTIGMIMDILITYNNENIEDDGIREATQSDFDNF